MSTVGNIMSTVGDIFSTVGGVQYRGGTQKTKVPHGTHGTHDIPTVLKEGS